MTESRFAGEGTGMAVVYQSLSLTRDDSWRHVSTFAPFGTYYGYFTAGAETV